MSEAKGICTNPENTKLNYGKTYDILDYDKPTQKVLVVNGKTNKWYSSRRFQVIGLDRLKNRQYINENSVLSMKLSRMKIRLDNSTIYNIALSDKVNENELTIKKLKFKQSILKALIGGLTVGLIMNVLIELIK